MALLFQYLPYLVLIALGVYTYKWATKQNARVVRMSKDEQAPAKRELFTGLVVRILIAFGAFMIASSINTNYGPRFKADPTPIVQSVTVDKNGNAPVIRDVERNTRLTAEQREERTKEMLDWRAAHAKRDAELAKQKAAE
jgi:hypothetical protein